MRDKTKELWKHIGDTVSYLKRLSYEVQDKLETLRNESTAHRKRMQEIDEAACRRLEKEKERRNTLEDDYISLARDHFHLEKVFYAANLFKIDLQKNDIIFTKRSSPLMKEQQICWEWVGTIPGKDLGYSLLSTTTQAEEGIFDVWIKPIQSPKNED